MLLAAPLRASFWAIQGARFRRLTDTLGASSSAIMRWRSSLIVCYAAFSAHHARLGTGLLKLELEAMNLSQVGCRGRSSAPSVAGVSHSVTWSRAAQRAPARDLPESVAAACLEFIPAWSARRESATSR